MAAQTAKDHGLRVDVMPEHAGVEDIVDALAEHVAELRAAGQLPPPRKRRRRRKNPSTNPMELEDQPATGATNEED